jgi:hypothetical protein
MPALKFWNRLRLMNLRQVKLARAPRTGLRWHAQIQGGRYYPTTHHTHTPSSTYPARGSKKSRELTGGAMHRVVLHGLGVLINTGRR